MKNNDDIVRTKVILKDVLVGYSGLDKLKAFKPGYIPKYNLSVILRGESFDKLERAVDKTTEGLKEYKRMEFKDEKFKKVSDWAKENLEVHDKDVQVQLNNKNKPKVHDYINKTKNPKIFSGDKVNVMFFVTYYPPTKNLGFVLEAVSLVRKGNRSSSYTFDLSGEDDWLNANEINKKDVEHVESLADDHPDSSLEEDDGKSELPF